MSWCFTLEHILRQSSVSNSSFNALLNMTWLARDPSWLRLPVMLVWDNWIALSTSRRRVTPSFGSPMNSRTKLEKLRSKSALSLTNNSVIELNCRRPISACCPWPFCYKTKLRIVIIYRGGALLLESTEFIYPILQLLLTISPFPRLLVIGCPLPIIFKLSDDPL